MTGKRYWEAEQPETAQTERNFIRYFREAGRLQVAQAYKDGEELKQGKTATLDAEDLATAPEMLDLLQKFIDECRESAVNSIEVKKP